MKTFPAIEGVSGVYKGILRDAELTPIPGSALTLLKLSLYVADVTDADSGSLANIVNDWNDEDCLTNGITVSVGGLMTWLTQPDDLKIMFARRRELHVARFRFEWDGDDGTLFGVHEVAFLVSNLRRYVAP